MVGYVEVEDFDRAVAGMQGEEVNARWQAAMRPLFEPLKSGAADTSLYDVARADGPVCLVLGSEGRGLSRLVRERCDEVVAIPMKGVLGSLNVSAAAALACFEIARHR